MKPDFWHEKWQQQQIGFHQQHINQRLMTHWSSLALPSEATVLVPLCGKSQDMHFLVNQGYKVLGCELSQLAVTQFFEDSALPVTMTTVADHQCYHSANISIYQGDFFTLATEITQDVSAFFDRAALIAWPESMRRQYVQQLAKLLPAGSVGLLITLDYPQELLQGPPFAVSPAWIEQYLQDYFLITALDFDDVLAEHPRFMSQGVPWLTEAVYVLRRK